MSNDSQPSHSSCQKALGCEWKNVLSVGNCGFDDQQIKACASELGLIHFFRASGRVQAMSVLDAEPFSLVFVNRIFDGDGWSGIDWLSEVVPRFPKTVFVLLSEKPEAQARALSNGARMALGKSQLRQAETAQQLKEAVHGVVSDEA